MGSGGSPHDEMRHTRDDLSLVYDATSGDAAVQTGSSLSSGFDIESLGSMLMSEWQQVLCRAGDNGKGVHSLYRQTRASVLSGFNTGSLGSMLMSEWKQVS